MRDNFKGLDKEDQQAMIDHFNNEVCPSENLGDYLFGDDTDKEELVDKIIGLDASSQTEFAEAIKDSRLVIVMDDKPE